MPSIADKYSVFVTCSVLVRRFETRREERKENEEEREKAAAQKPLHSLVGPNGFIFLFSSSFRFLSVSFVFVQFFFIRRL